MFSTVFRSSTRQLKASGNVLTHLSGALDGHLFSNVVWRFYLDASAAPPRAANTGSGAPDEDSAAAVALPHRPAELPYHRCAPSLVTFSHAADSSDTP